MFSTALLAVCILLPAAAFAAGDQECTPQPTINCEDRKIIDGIEYRTYDGSCNNLKRPYEAMVDQRYVREGGLDAYEDGISSAKTKQLNGDPLPSARVVSVTISPDVDKLDKKRSNMVVQFGQFVAHDTSYHVENYADCCDPKKIESRADCFGIMFDKSKDPYYANQSMNNGCISMGRTVGVIDCESKKLMQLNRLTSTIDLGHFYGYKDYRWKGLRSFVSGKLKVTEIKGQEFPPINLFTEINEASRDLCSSKGQCISGGDLKAVQNANIANTHILWTRFHNQIADGLAAVNPDWDDEHLFQESKRILTAITQHILYNEWLPVMVGADAVKQLDLIPQKTGYFSGYNDSINIGCGLAVAFASMRMHNLARGEVDIRKGNPSCQTAASACPFLKRIRLYQTYSTQEPEFEEGMDGLIEGALNEPIAAWDSHATVDLNDMLFKDLFPGFPGIDLTATDIQRGRDAGLPGYNHFRSYCGLRKFQDWKDMETEFPVSFVQKLKSLYNSVDDVELRPAGMQEKPEASDALIGPTFACLIGQHFYRQKHGDRFYYESDAKGISFTDAQLQNIRSIKLSRILCETTTMKYVQKDGLLLHSERIPCADYQSLPNIDTSLWSANAV